MLQVNRSSLVAKQPLDRKVKDIAVYNKETVCSSLTIILTAFLESTVGKFWEIPLKFASWKEYFVIFNETATI